MKLPITHTETLQGHKYSCGHALRFGLIRQSLRFGLLRQALCFFNLVREYVTLDNIYEVGFSAKFRNGAEMCHAIFVDHPEIC